MTLGVCDSLLFWPHFEPQNSKIGIITEVVWQIFNCRQRKDTFLRLYTHPSHGLCNWGSLDPLEFLEFGVVPEEKICFFRVKELGEVLDVETHQGNLCPLVRSSTR